MLRLSSPSAHTLAWRGLAVTAAAVPPAAAPAAVRLTCRGLASAQAHGDIAHAASTATSRTFDTTSPAACTAKRLQQRWTATAAVAPPAAAPATSQSPSEGRPAACDTSAYQGLSLVVLMHECIQRAYGRPLMPNVKDPLSLPTQLDSLPCCVVLLAPPPQPLNVAASCARATACNGAPAASLSDPDPSRSDMCGPGNPASISSEASTSGRVTPRTGSRALQVPYMNQAAAEALKLVGSSGTGSNGGDLAPTAQDGRWRRVAWSLLGTEEEGSEWLQMVLAAQGQPRRGQLRSLHLRTGQPTGEGVAPGAAPFITCPGALVLGLMSPNGTCAGLAVLFDRWEVRSEGGALLLQGRPLVPELPPGALPDEQALADLQDRVRGQADSVRALKTAAGRTNQDSVVIAAVTELQRLKAELDLKQRLRAAFTVEAGGVQQLVASV